MLPCDMPSRLLLLSAIIPILGQLASAESLPTAEKTALDAYIAKPDPSYNYELAAKIEQPDFTGYVISMTSQTWLSAKEVSPSVWKHELRIVVPKGVSSDTALLFIGGGSTREKPKVEVKPELVRVAKAGKVIVAELGQVPNQPSIFADDPEQLKRSEDSLIVYTWNKFLRGGKDEWLARLPMTKAAVRAMDTVQDFCKGDKGPGIKVTSFVVAGGSKRGWTTWTTAAVDKRVKSIVPIVIDVLNMVPSMQHHHSAYGFFAPAIDDYSKGRIMDWEGQAEYGKLMKIEEPFSYRARFTMPKLIVNATGDQFFLPDSSQFYFDQLPGEKYLRYVPNADHSLKGSDAYETLAAYCHCSSTDHDRPKFSWKSDKEGELRATVETKPTEVRLWRASNTKARDFRQMTIGNVWTSSVLEAKENDYLASVPKPEQGWTAFMIELTYDVGAPFPLKLTTNVEVVPRALPFHPYQPKDPR